MATSFVDLDRNGTTFSNRCCSDKKHQLLWTDGSDGHGSGVVDSSLESGSGMELLLLDEDGGESWTTPNETDDGSTLSINWTIASLSPSLSSSSGSSWSPTSSVTTGPQLPLDMQFNSGNVVAIAAYSVLLVVAAVGNFKVLITLHHKQKQRRSRVNLLLMHLAVADLMVTFLLMPLEIAWSITVSWWADDAACRIMAFFRVFGIYLSSFILICISVDRYNAVIHPLQVRGASRRAKNMIVVAWIAGVVCSAPQIVVFRLENHPDFPWYYQCITLNTFPNSKYHMAYNLFVMVAMYGIPLIVIVVTYGAIIFKISRKSQECNGVDPSPKSGHREVSLRRSGPENLNRAKSKTLRMTIIIVAVFIMCWTPYYILCLWFLFDSQSALKLDFGVQKGLFIFAASNSCMNPLVYGFFMVKCACLGRRAQVKRTPL